MPDMRISVQSGVPPNGSAADAVASLSRRFKAAGLDTPGLDARLLVLSACGLSREEFVRDPYKPIGPCELGSLESMAARRLAHETVSSILGRREFWGLDFHIGPDVLDPRPDTETLVEAALDILEREGLLNAPIRIADLGTGSGCILLALLSELPSAWGIGVDIDTRCLAVARINAERLGVSDRCSFAADDWGGSLSECFDLVVTNPPYIETQTIESLSADVRLYDPHRALDGGADGLEAFRSIALRCPCSMKNGAWILFESGAGQTDAAIDVFRQSEWGKDIGGIRVYSDLAGIRRVVAIKRQA